VDIEKTSKAELKGLEGRVPWAFPVDILFTIAIKMTLIYNFVMEVFHGKKNDVYTGGDFKSPVNKGYGQDYRRTPEGTISIVDDRSRS
jgi:hypothetical protein